jgi:hypothetical protein
VLTTLLGNCGPEVQRRAASSCEWKLCEITNAGLATMAALVVVLWSCVVGEQMVMRRANTEGRQAMRELQVLRLKHGARAAERRGLPGGRSITFSKL